MNQPEQSSAGDRINREQRRLDAADGKIDATIKAGDDAERLTATYVERVNDVQGRVAKLREYLSRQNDRESSHWQRARDACDEIERGLLLELNAIDERTLPEYAQRFNERVDAYLATLEPLTPPETKPVYGPEPMRGMRETNEHEAAVQALENARRSYLVNEERVKTVTVRNDIEYTALSVGSEKGYVPYLESLLREVQDRDEWLWDGSEEARKERMLLRSAAGALERNLTALEASLDANAHVADTLAYERLRSLYAQRSARFTQLLAGADLDLSNSELLDAERAGEQAEKTLARMTLDEALAWSEGLFVTMTVSLKPSADEAHAHEVVANAIKRALETKLAEEKATSIDDPAKRADYARNAIRVSKLFTGRSGPLAARLTDIDLGSRMAREAMQFDNLALRYAEKQSHTIDALNRDIDAKRGSVLARIASLPEAVRNHREVQAMVTTLLQPFRLVPQLSQQYAILRMLEAQFTGAMPPDVQGELQTKLADPLEAASRGFETFLNRKRNLIAVDKGALTLEALQQAVGDPPLTPEQTEAWRLLSEIEGYRGMGDREWQQLAVVGKVSAMIAAGVAVGVATGGLGIVASALAGGAMMTAVGAALDDEGVDSVREGARKYGTEFVANTATMGLARYLGAGRTAWQLRQAGKLGEAGGVGGVLKAASQRGGLQNLSKFDDVARFGTRFAGATIEGAADTVVGATIDTYWRDEADFLSNLENNAMFFGLAYAEFLGPMRRGLRDLPGGHVDRIARTTDVINAKRGELHALCQKAGIATDGVMTADRVEDALASVDDPQVRAEIEKTAGELRQLGDEFLDELKEAAGDLGDAGSESGVSETARPRSGAEATKLERAKIVAPYLEYLTAYPDVPDSVRLEIAEALVGPLSPEQIRAILLAHSRGGEIGNLTFEQVRLRQEDLKKAFGDSDHIRLLIESGVCGNAPTAPVQPLGRLKPPPPPPTPRNKAAAPSVTVSKAPPPPPAPRHNKAPVPSSAPAAAPQVAPVAAPRVDFASMYAEGNPLIVRDSSGKVVGKGLLARGGKSGWQMYRDDGTKFDVDHSMTFTVDIPDASARPSVAPHPAPQSSVVRPTPTPMPVASNAPSSAANSRLPRPPPAPPSNANKKQSAAPNTPAPTIDADDESLRSVRDPNNPSIPSLAPTVPKTASPVPRQSPAARSSPSLPSSKPSATPSVAPNVVQAPRAMITAQYFGVKNLDSLVGKTLQLDDGTVCTITRAYDPWNEPDGKQTSEMRVDVSGSEWSGTLFARKKQSGDGVEFFVRRTAEQTEHRVRTFEGQPAKPKPKKKSKSLVQTLRDILDI